MAASLSAAGICPWRRPSRRPVSGPSPALDSSVADRATTRSEPLDQGAHRRRPATVFGLNYGPLPGGGLVKGPRAQCVSIGVRPVGAHRARHIKIAEHDHRRRRGMGVAVMTEVGVRPSSPVAPGPCLVAPRAVRLEAVLLVDDGHSEAMRKRRRRSECMGATTMSTSPPARSAVRRARSLGWCGCQQHRAHRRALQPSGVLDHERTR